MKKCLFAVICLLSLGSLSGCVVYEPRPRVYSYPAYTVYEGPSVVYVREGYYYRRGYCR